MVDTGNYTTADYRSEVAQNEEAGEKDEKELCRDFKYGDCRRGARCIFYHPKLDVCRDYRAARCQRAECKYVHATRDEEEVFDKSGILPSHITNGPFGKSGGSRKRRHESMAMPSSNPMSFGAPPPPAPSTDLCRDFEKGDCRRGDRCKFYHPKLVLCRDYKKGKCDRDDCRYLHLTVEEEETYYGNGIVPDHIDILKLRKNKIMAPEDNRRGAGHGVGAGVAAAGSHLLAGISEIFGSSLQSDHHHQGGGGGTVPKHQFDTILQENQAIKLKLVDMQQQITDLRRMNDTLYEQNCGFRKKFVV